MKNILLSIVLMVSCLMVAAQQMPRLRPGDTVAIVSPARGLSEKQLQPSLDMLAAQGYYVLVGEHVMDNEGIFAGTDAQRAADFQAALDNPSVKAIICARGGYGSVRFIDQLDFTQFRAHPKWICGFSDVTVFHSYLQAMGYPTLHSVMPITMRNEEKDVPYIESLFSALRGDSLRYAFAPNPQNRLGEAEGVVVGGNLSILYSLLGSVSDIDTEGKILFIEDTDEYLYHIDRMMRALKRAGKLSGLKGLIVGGMNKIHDNSTPFGQDVQNIILTVCADYDFPICFDFPAGHCGQNYALPLGTVGSLRVGETECELFFDAE